MRFHVPLFLAAAISASPVAAQVVYVNASATGANDGSSWVDAFTDLQIALLSAGPQDPIWVAAGTYRPTATGSRDVSFRVGHNQAMYGGFAGTETSFEQRAGLFDATILTGDLAGDDGPDFTNVSDNSYHVVKLESGASGIDGFTVTGGNAENSEGGGLDGFLVTTRIENCTFRANRADWSGGAVCLTWAESSILRRCVFVGNHARFDAGGLSIGTVDDLARVELCRFLGNTAGIGGGMGSTGVEIVGCEFSGNSARSGGAIYDSSVKLESCTVVGNFASSSGVAGGIQAEYAEIHSCIVWGNRNGDGDGEGAQLTVAPPATVEGSCVQGWTGQLDDGPGNLFGDPRFVDSDGQDDISGTIDDDLRLGPSSSCLDTGTPPTGGTPLPARDLAGAVRFVDSLSCDTGGGQSGVLDIGARERQSVDGSTSFCGQAPTSLGVPAEIAAPCVVGVASGVLHFRVGPVPSSTGIIFCGSEIASTPFGGDTFCVGGSVHRLPQPTATGSHLGLSLELTEPRGAAFVPGSTWHFQALFRDGGTLRLSDATTITFRE